MLKEHERYTTSSPYAFRRLLPLGGVGFVVQCLAKEPTHGGWQEASEADSARGTRSTLCGGTLSVGSFVAVLRQAFLRRPWHRERESLMECEMNDLARSKPWQ